MKIPGDRILLEPIEQAKTSGFETLKDKDAQMGKIVDMGKGSYFYTMSYEKGDTVVYAKGAGTAVKFQGKDYIIMRETESYFAI